MNWYNAREALATFKPPTGYELAQLEREDVPHVVAGLRSWYPDVVVGAESCHLDPDFYYQKTMLADVTEDRDVFPMVAKHLNGIAAMMTFEKNGHSRTITCRMGAIAPDHRGPALALLGPMLLDNLGRAIGAELAYYFATLKTPHQQVLAERLRYQLVGIVPGYDRDMVRPGEIRRVYEAVYARILIGPDRIELPLLDALTSRTQALWKAIFGALPPADATIS
jgi:hypothetical protein